jgi:hypothetical protein
MNTFTHRRSSVALTALIGLTACSHATSPAAPSNAIPAQVTYYLEGHVMDEAGAAVAGAMVGSDYSSSLATTDQNGTYQLAATPKTPLGWFHVAAWKAGYDETVQYVDPREPIALRLFQPLTMPASGQLHATLGTDNSLCGAEDEFLCRTILITAPASTAIAVVVTPDEPGRTVWITLNTPLHYPINTTRVQIDAGATREFLLLGGEEGFTIQI